MLIPYNPTSFRLSASRPKSGIDRASPRMEGWMSASSSAFSSSVCKQRNFYIFRCSKRDRKSAVKND